MKICSVLMLVLLTVCLVVPVAGQEAVSGQEAVLGQQNVSGQQTGVVRTATTNRQFNLGPKVAPVSLTTPARALQRPHIASAEPQIRVNIRYLMVDDASREAIYDHLADANLKTKMQQIAEAEPESLLATKGTALESSQTIFTTSCVTSCVMGHDQMKFVMNTVARSPGSHLSKAPSLILVDGQEGQMNEMVQRPFVAGIQSSNLPKTPTKEDKRGRPITPNVQVLDDGTAIRIRAAGIEPNVVHLSGEIMSTKILGVKTKRVFGLGSKSAMQAPQLQVERAVAAEEMQFGQTLLIDPYIAEEIEVQQERGVPMLTKIPYVKHAFKNTAVARTNVNWMVILEPVRMK